MIIDIIQYLHFLLIICITLSIIIPYTQYKIYILGTLTCLLFRYLSGYTRCGLTELEYIIKGQKYKEGFIYRLIHPILTIPEEYFDTFLFDVHIIWIIILVYQINK